MTVEQNFFVSVLRSVDNNFSCHLMTSDSRLTDTIQQLKDTRIHNYYSEILLSTENKNTLIEHVLAFNSEKYISYFRIFKDYYHLVFISYDGFKKGVISSIIPLSEDFIAKFVKTKMCLVTGKVTLTQDFFISVLSLFKEDNLFCEFQSSDKDLMNTIKKNDSVIVEDDYSVYFPLNDETKKILIKTVIQYHSEKYMHYFEIKRSNIPLLISYDGFEIVQVASEIQLPESFIEKYVKTELCIVVDKIIYPHDQLKYNIQPVRIKF